jgi:hypothetical protein
MPDQANDLLDLSRKEMLAQTRIDLVESPYWHQILHEDTDIVHHQQVEQDLRSLGSQFVIPCIELLHEQNEGLLGHSLSITI